MYFIIAFLRKRYKKLKSLDSKSSMRRTEELRAVSDSAATELIGAGAVVGLNKENGQHERAESIDSHIILPNPHPRDLPPLPPLGIDDATPSMAQRNSVVLSYVPPPTTLANGNPSLSRSISQLSRSSSLHEDMIVHQKDLEANYGMAENGEESSPHESSGSRLAVIDEHPFEPPPQYRE